MTGWLNSDPQNDVVRVPTVFVVEPVNHIRFTKSCVTPSLVMAGKGYPNKILSKKTVNRFH